MEEKSGPKLSANWAAMVPGMPVDLTTDGEASTMNRCRSGRGTRTS